MENIECLKLSESFNDIKKLYDIIESKMFALSDREQVAIKAMHGVGEYVNNIHSYAKLKEILHLPLVTKIIEDKPETIERIALKKLKEQLIPVSSQFYSTFNKNSSIVNDMCRISYELDLNNQLTIYKSLENIVTTEYIGIIYLLSKIFIIADYTLKKITQQRLIEYFKQLCTKLAQPPMTESKNNSVHFNKNIKYKTLSEPLHIINIVESSKIILPDLITQKFEKYIVTTNNINFYSVVSPKIDYYGYNYVFESVISPEIGFNTTEKYVFFSINSSFNNKSKYSDFNKKLSIEQCRRVADGLIFPLSFFDELDSDYPYSDEDLRKILKF